MGKELIRQALQDLVKEGAPEHTSLWVSTREQLESNPKSRAYTGNKHNVSARGKASVFHNGLNLAVILILLLMVGGATVFVTRNNTPTTDAPLNANNVAALRVTPTNQTVNGYTVNLYPSYAPEGWLSLSYTVSDPQGKTLSLYEPTQNGLHINYQNNAVDSKIVPRLVDNEERSYPVIGSGPLFAWSHPLNSGEETPITDIEAHQIESQPGTSACCLPNADVIMWNFDPLASVTKGTTRNMHLEMTVFLPGDVLRSDSETNSASSGVLDLKALNYKNTAQARIAFDFVLPSR